MSGNNNTPFPSQGSELSVREAAIKLLADLDGAVQETGRASITLVDPPHRAVEALRRALQAERSADTQIPEAELVREGIDRIRSGADPALVTPRHIVAIVEAADKAFEFARSFGVRHEADLRAIRRWQSAEPSRDVAQLVAAARAFEEAGEEINQLHLLDNLRSAIETVERYSIDGAADRSMIWPDHTDLLVWLLELVEQRPTCPSPDEVDEMARRLRAVYVASPMINDAVEMMLKLANALIASSRRTVQAERERAIIPHLIAAWLRTEAESGPSRPYPLISAARGVEAGEWNPFRDEKRQSGSVELSIVDTAGDLVPVRPLEPIVRGVCCGCGEIIRFDPILGSRCACLDRSNDCVGGDVLEPPEADEGEVWGIFDPVDRLWVWPNPALVPGSICAWGSEDEAGTWVRSEAERIAELVGDGYEIRRPRVPAEVEDQRLRRHGPPRFHDSLRTVLGRPDV